MKIGILTYHHVINDGAVLQTLGHVYTLKELFPEANIEVIDYRHKTFDWVEQRDLLLKIAKFDKNVISQIKKYLSFKKFILKYLPLSKEKLVSDDINAAVTFINKQNYDYIIVGSDEVWKVLNKKYSRKFPTIYWLPSQIKAIKIGSAVSANASNEKLLNEENVRLYIKECVVHYKAIAARDMFTYNLINSIDSSLNLYSIPDPTFGVEFKVEGVQQKLIKCGVDFNRKRFLLNLTSNHKDFAKVSAQFRQYADENNIQLVGIGQYNKYCDINLVHELNPLEWADCYRFFDFCLTDRFHSTIFSIKNKIPFMAVEYPSKYKGVNRGKIVDLLTKLDKMENHFFYDDNIDFKVQLGKIINNFDVVSYENIIKNLKEEFRNHLIKNITNNN